jgi:hypothetical protein
MIGPRPNRASLFKSATLSDAGILSEAQRFRGLTGDRTPKCATLPSVLGAGRLRLRRSW